jgi:hypothetical protein
MTPGEGFKASVTTYARARRTSSRRRRAGRASRSGGGTPRLAVALGELDEGAEDRVALRLLLGGIPARRLRRAGAQAGGEPVAAGGRAAPVGQALARDGVQPGQRVLRDRAELGPGDRERLVRHLLGLLGIGPAQREAVNVAVVRGEERLEAVL